jgi:hypothetical protein
MVGLVPDESGSQPTLHEDMMRFVWAASADNNKPFTRRGMVHSALKASEQLCPPKPKLFERSFLTRTSRAILGM